MTVEGELTLRGKDVKDFEKALEKLKGFLMKKPELKNCYRHVFINVDDVNGVESTISDGLTITKIEDWKTLENVFEKAKMFPTSNMKRFYMSAKIEVE